MPELIVNFDDPEVRARFLRRVAGARGKWRFLIKRYRPRRSDRQNRAYWPMIVVPFAQWLSEQNGERVGEETAHAILKDTLLRVPLVNRHGETVFDANGDPLMRTRSTTELNTAEFAAYFDDCRRLLADLCGIEVPDPDPGYADVGHK